MDIEDFKIRVSEDLLARALCAEQTLRECGDADVLDAARFVRELCRTGRTRKFSRLRKIFEAGLDALAQRRRTPTFAVAFERYLLAKSHLRERTRYDYLCVFRKLVRRDPSLRAKKMHSFGPKFGELVFPRAFRTPRQRLNAYSVLHAFFGYCVRHGWMDENPLAKTDVPCVREREIAPLTPPEISALFRSATRLGLDDCVPAIALMLFAGIRPREVERLRWRDVDWEENVVSIAPTHSKTGGCRHVNLPPILKKILLLRRGSERIGPICPPNWRRKWKRIRKNAGWLSAKNPWRQDVLRHTFASYHLKFFRNLTRLQCEMGHGSLRLLRTRYLSMRGVTREAASRFWSGECVRGVLFAPEKTPPPAAPEPAEDAGTRPAEGAPLAGPRERPAPEPPPPNLAGTPSAPPDSTALVPLSRCRLGVT